MAEATPYSPESLIGTEATSWFDLRPILGSVTLVVTVTGTVSYYVDVSNDERAIAAKEYVSSTAYTASVAKVLDVDRMPDFVRVRMASGSGTIKVAIGKARNADGKKTRPSAQSEHDS